MNKMEKSPSIDASYENLKKLTDILDDAREKLYKRLQESKNAYHNLQHSQEVSQTLKIFLDHLATNTAPINKKEKLLLLECALRHDDGHSGSTYRQDIAGGDLSNEEYAVKLLKQDLEQYLSAEDIKFMENHILATSFGQNNKDTLPEDKQSYYRQYKPETDSQKLLALADVSGFIKGWDEWANQGFRLLEESPQNTPPNIDTWIINGENFLNYYVSPLLASVRDALDSEYFNELEKSLNLIKEKLSVLKNKSNPERKKYEDRLNAIRENNDTSF
jgi:hypothetical protein